MIKEIPIFSFCFFYFFLAFAFVSFSLKSKIPVVGIAAARVNLLLCLNLFNRIYATINVGEPLGGLLGWYG